MKLAGFPLLLSAGSIAVSLGAQSTTSIVSRETSARIREGMPTYAPPLPPGDATAAPTDFPPTTDPTVLILPKLTVEEKRLPSDAADHLMSRRDFNRKMRNLDHDDLAKDSPLEAFLNSFAIPLFSPSLVDRGRALARGKELDRLADLLSPEEAKGLNGIYDDLARVVGKRAPKRR